MTSEAKATPETLAHLWSLLLRALIHGLENLSEVGDDRMQARYMSVARQFLRDNGCMNDIKRSPTTAEGLAELLRALAKDGPISA